MTPAFGAPWYVGRIAVSVLTLLALATSAPAQSRLPADDEDLRFWLRNMALHHGFTDAEITAATGLSDDQIHDAFRRFGIDRNHRPAHTAGEPLRVLPYPGGRHPRIGFLDGAVDPQRETKVSVFTPWDPSSYVVVDVPEAIWFQRGLLYLAHTHVPTIWTERKETLPPLEWTRNEDGSLTVARLLPNKVAFRASVRPVADAVHRDLWLTNGSPETLRDLRVQNCVMLKAAHGFQQQTNENKSFGKPYVSCRSADSNRWIITGWDRCHRVWGNPPVPCLHSDPKFPDCPPGETRHLRGWLSFYQGTNIQAEMARIEKTGWRKWD